MNFEGIKELFSKAKVPENGKPYLPNTRIMKRGDSYAVRLHETDIVVFNPDGTIVLNSGGYRTPTTKDRMNVVLDGLGVYQDKGLWYVGTGFTDQSCLFFDGIILKDGKILNPKNPLDMEACKRRVDILVKRYIDGFIAHITFNGLEQPGAGDCFACSMKATDGRPDALGIDHFFSHFEERYFVPSLFYNAMVEMNYGNIGIVWGMMERDNEYMTREARNILNKYFRKRKLALAEYLMKKEE